MLSLSHMKMNVGDTATISGDLGDWRIECVGEGRFEAVHTSKPEKVLATGSTPQEAYDNLYEWFIQTIEATLDIPHNSKAGSDSSG